METGDKPVKKLLSLKKKKETVVIIQGKGSNKNMLDRNTSWEENGKFIVEWLLSF